MQVIFSIDYDTHYVVNFKFQATMLRNNLLPCRNFPLIHASIVNNGSIGLIERTFVAQPGVNLHSCSYIKLLTDLYRMKIIFAPKTIKNYSFKM